MKIFFQALNYKKMLIKHDFFWYRVYKIYFNNINENIFINLNNNKLIKSFKNWNIK